MFVNLFRFQDVFVPEERNDVFEHNVINVEFHHRNFCFESNCQTKTRRIRIKRKKQHKLCINQVLV
jgi:hypothetical protein